MIHSIASDDVVAAMYQLIDEATVTNGRYISIQQFPGLPESVRKEIYDSAIRHKIITKGKVAESDEPFALLGQDTLDSAIQYTLEDYDKGIDEAILTSENIVKAYNEMISAHFDKAIEALNRLLEADKTDTEEEFLEKYNQLNHTNVAGAVRAIHSITKNRAIANMSAADQKKAICEAIYRPSDDPEEIKQIVNARIAYNNTVINLLKNMLQINYQLLGVSKDEALLLSTKLDSSDSQTRKTAIADVKKIVAANESKFRKGSMIDLRSLGGGVYIQTAEDMGNMGGVFNFDRILQITMTHDVVVCGHGGEVNDKAETYAKKAEEAVAREDAKRDEEYKKIVASREALQEKYKQLISNLQYTNASPIIREVILIQRKFDELGDEYDKKYDAFFEARKILVEKKMSIDEDEIGQKQADQLANEIDKELDKLKAEWDRYEAEYDKRYDEIRKMMYEVERRAKVQGEKIPYQYQQRQNEYDYMDYVNKLEKEGTLPPDIQKLRGELKALKTKIDKYPKYSSEEHDRQVKEAKAIAARIERRFKDEGRWTIQEITTPGGKKCTDVNDLVRTLIKEGFKDILLISCNPGGHSLAKDIRDAKDVKIHYAKASLLAESTVMYNGPEAEPLNEAWNALDETEEHLIGVCDRMGINYFDDNLLAESFTSTEFGAITEGTLADVWNKLKELIKKALRFLVGLFKKMIEIGKRVLDKVKAFFARIFQRPGAKNSSFNKPLKFGRIIVESAKADKVDTRSWADLEKAIIPACESISKKIQVLERQQVSNMEELSRYAESKARTIKESANPLYDHIISLCMT